MSMIDTTTDFNDTYIYSLFISRKYDTKLFSSRLMKYHMLNKEFTMSVNNVGYVDLICIGY